MLKIKRKALRLNQDYVSNYLNISRHKLSEIENKHDTDLKISLIYKICKLYKLDLLEFLDWLNV